MFKKYPRLTIALYACSLLALVYTGFMLFYSYDSITSYYASYNAQAGFSEILTTLVGNAFTPFMLSVILYALGSVVAMLSSIREEFEVVADQEDQQTKLDSQEEKAEEDIKPKEDSEPQKESSEGSHPE